MIIGISPYKQVSAVTELEVVLNMTSHSIILLKYAHISSEGLNIFVRCINFLYRRKKYSNQTSIWILEKTVFASIFHLTQRLDKV
jgi:hypothetical protein